MSGLLAEPTSTAIVLFTRDLRVHDQPAVSQAVRESQRVLPLFVLDERLLGGRAGTPNRLAFLVDCLRDLDTSLCKRGAGLILRRGDPVTETLKLARRHRATAIFTSADVSAYAHERQRRLQAECERERIELRLFEGVCVLASGAVLPAGGDHYRVFTPYWRAWQTAPRRAVERAPRRIELPAGVNVGRLPSLKELVRGTPSPQLPRGGETLARKALTRWLSEGLATYDATRDDLGADASSHMSAHLHFGCLSATEIEARAQARGGGQADAYVRQLCWRDFHHQVLSANPGLADVDYRDCKTHWRHNARFAQAWREGKTGMPIVDAGMRQLAHEGFMRNRARMIVASYLTKSAGLDWRIGARHFEALLVDCDLACNSGNWQWVAGTGNDTRPNRVLSPLRQARRFDPAGDYVRRYVPELADIDGAEVHEPWLLPSRLRRSLDYPQAPLLPPAGATQR